MTRYIVRQECSRIYKSDQIEASSLEEAEKKFLSGNIDLDFLEEICDPPNIYTENEWLISQGLPRQ